MRRFDYGDLINPYFSLNKDFKKRDEIAVHKTVSGLAKLIYPNQQAGKEEMRELLEYAIEGRRRVKEQLKKMAGVEFIDTNLGYIDDNTGENIVVTLPGQSSHSLIPEGSLRAGFVYAVGKSIQNGDVAVYRLENKVVEGNAKMETQGIPTHAKSAKECVNAAFYYFIENAGKLCDISHQKDFDYLLYYSDSQEKGISDEISLAEFIGLCSALSRRPIIASVVIVGEIKLSGSMMPLTSIEDIVRVSINAGARQILLPMDSREDYDALTPALTQRLCPLFYADPIDAAKKAMGIF